MDDIWVRIAIVAVVFAVALGIALARRGRKRVVRTVPVSDLAPGLYLFSSEGCATCDSARALVVEGRGDDFTEFVWEHQPEPFGKLGVDAVPSVLVVDETGAGRLFPGQPQRALRSI